MAVTKVADRVEQKLREQGSIGSGDIAEFGVEQRVDRSARGRAAHTSTMAPVPSVADKDPIMVNSEQTATEALKVKQEAELGDTPDKLSAEMYQNDKSEPEFSDEKVELTPDDKDAFIDAMVAGTRYERPFSLFGGRLNGVFRSRTTAESLAILKELARQWTLTDYMTQDEYSTMLRFAMLAAQLKEFNGVAYPEMQEPLLAVSRVVGDKEDGKEIVEPPKWFSEMKARFGGKDEGLYTAVYRQLRMFDRKYWALVAHADDQNFWRPSQSTSA